MFKRKFMILDHKNYYCQTKVNAVEMKWEPKLQLLSKFLSLEALFKGRPIMSICNQLWMEGYVGDEAVHKELGDRMERAATTDSSLEAEQDSGSGPRCQDTILGDVNAQTRFEITSKQSNDPPLSRGYTLGSGEDSMKQLELMELCTQLSYKNRKSVLFLLLVYFNAAKLMLMLLGSVNAARLMLMLPVQATAKVQMVNGVRQLQALVDKKRVIVTESSIRRDLHLDDAEGTDCLPTVTIFEELARMGYEKPSQKLTFYKAFFSPQWKYFIHTITQCLSAKSTAWNEFSSTMASLIICLATNQKFNLSKYIFDAMVKHLDGGVKFLMYPRFLQVFINQQLGDMSTHKKIFVNPFHTKKVFANMKRPVHKLLTRVLRIILYDSARTFRVILFSIHNDEWKSFQCHHQTALRSCALSWKPCQGDSLNLPDHRIHKDGDGDALFQLKSDSLPHAHAQTIKTFYKHQDSRIMKAQELKTKTSA
ncbi:hypothetical protein Tco_0780035 [Tanacetum coccineum]